MKDWKDRIRHVRVGERTELKSIEGFWVRPRKLNTEEHDEIQAAQAAVLGTINRAEFIKAHKRLNEVKSLAADQGITDVLSDAELESLLDSQFLPAARIVRLLVLHGVAEHNFCEGESTEEMNETIADEILQVPQIAQEIAMIVQRFNPPLGMGTSGTSATSRNGSITQANSTKETSSQMEGIQSS